MLQDTSFAIHPGKEQKDGAIVYRDIGNVTEYKKDGSTYHFNCMNGHVTIQFYSEKIVRVTMNTKQEVVLNQSKSVIVDPQAIEIIEENTDETIVLKSMETILRIQ